ncbi:MAG TPA: DUF2510 domain-containing protein [Solirubrobacterales bacterium]|nr:DUF2510 domain-containing protein [Solirubrobacterales bacterium]
MNSTETPGGSGIPAGWYDDPSGTGLRWWDGEQWTEHVHTAESAAAAAGDTGGSGSREGKPPRDLVKLRERIRARGVKGVGIVLGAIVVVIVVIALLVSGGSDNSSNANPPQGNNPAAKTGKGAAGTQAQIKAINKQLKNKNLPKAKKKQLEAQKKKLQKSAKSGNGKKSGKNAKKQGEAKKETSPGEEGN